MEKPFKEIRRMDPGWREWDAEPLFVLSEKYMVAVLEKFLNGEICARDISLWAETLYGRETVEYESEAITQVLTELSSFHDGASSAHQVLDREMARKYVQLLNG